MTEDLKSDIEKAVFDCVVTLADKTEIQRACGEFVRQIIEESLPDVFKEWLEEFKGQSSIRPTSTGFSYSVTITNYYELGSLKFSRPLVIQQAYHIIKNNFWTTKDGILYKSPHTDLTIEVLKGAKKWV